MKDLSNVGRFFSLLLPCMFVRSGYWVPCGELDVGVPPLLSVALVLPMGYGDRGEIGETKEPTQAALALPSEQHSASAWKRSCDKHADSDVMMSDLRSSQNHL